MMEQKSFLEQYTERAAAMQKEREENADQYVQNRVESAPKVMSPLNEKSDAVERRQFQDSERKRDADAAGSEHREQIQYRAANTLARSSNGKLDHLSQVFREEGAGIRKSLGKLEKILIAKPAGSGSGSGLGLFGDLLESKMGKTVLGKTKGVFGKVLGSGKSLLGIGEEGATVASTGSRLMSGISKIGGAATELLGPAAPVLGRVGSVMGKIAAPLAIGTAAWDMVSEGAKEDSTERYAKRFGTDSSDLGDGSIGSMTKFAALRAGGAATDLAQSWDPSKLWNEKGDSWTDRMFNDRRGDAGKKGSVLDSSSLVGGALTRSIAVAMSPFSEDARTGLLEDWNGTIIPGMTSAFKPVADAATAMTSSLSTFKESVTNFLDNFKLSTGQLADGIKGAASSVWSSVKGAASSVATGYSKDGVRGAVNASREVPAQLAKGATEAYTKIADAGTAAKGISAGRWTAEEAASIKAQQDAGGSFKAGKEISEQTRAKITAEAIKQGIPPEHLLAMTQMESGGNTNAVSTTGAAGLGQFTAKTAKQYGITNRFDEDQNITGLAKLYNDNKAALVKRGVDPSLDNIYLAHQEGAGGAAQIVKAAGGKGQLSDDIKKNMGVNVGAGGVGQTDAEYAASFAAKNSKQLSAAYTAANGKSNVATGVAPVASAQLLTATSATSATVEKSKTSPVSAVITASSVTGGSSKPIAEKVQQASIAPTVLEEAKVVSNSIPMLSQSVPKEVEQVSVVNSPEVVQQNTQPTTVAQNTQRGRPTLDDIPIVLNDAGLVLLQSSFI